MSIFTTNNVKWKKAFTLERDVEFFEFTEALARSRFALPIHQWFIQGMYGITVDGIHNLQPLRIGDFVIRDPNDTQNQEVIQCKHFLEDFSLPEYSISTR